MRVICKKHGPSPGVLVCSAIREKIQQEQPLTDVVKIEIEYEGEIANICYLTKEIAMQYGINNDCKVPLGDDYPDFMSEKAKFPECVHCVEEARIGK